MVIAMGVAAMASAAVVVAWFSGYVAGRNGVYRRLQEDTQFRRDVVEQLARREGLRLVGHE